MNSGVSQSAPAYPKIFNKLADIPTGKVLNEKFMGLTENQKNQVVVFAPQAIQDEGPSKVIVIGTDDYMRSASFLELRKRLQNNKLVIVAQALATSNLLKTMHENANQDLNEYRPEETHRGDAHDLFDQIIAYSLKEKVSDIHIEKRVTRSMIRMRKHGQMMEYQDVSNGLADRLCRISYNVLAKGQPDVQFKEDTFQAVSINTDIEGEEVKLRFQSLPTYNDGFDVVMRVLPIGTDEEKITPLEKLGYETSQMKMLLDISSKPVGAMVIAGTTGSGKSTTLKNLLMYINNARQYRCKIYTIEDPPEYKIPKVSQIPVRRTAEDDPNISAFIEPIKACMRGDPDILMIGEVRDSHTADGLKKLTQSGHQVLTTVHATSALGIVERLRDLGIVSGVMGSPEFLNGLIYQKLLPVVCPNCCINFNELVSSTKATSSDLALGERLHRIGALKGTTIRVRGRGCDQCNQMGIIDRTVCAEIVEPDYVMLDCFKNELTTDAVYHWRSMSDEDPDSDNMVGKTVLEHALFKMRKGIVCPKDIEEHLGKVDKAQKDWLQMKNARFITKKEQNKDHITHNTPKNPEADVALDLKNELDL